MARSASVREPSKPHTSNMSPVGGLSHQGKIDPEQAEKSKAPRDAKRRTVQVEYVAPQSATVRGELSPPPTKQPAALASPIIMSSNDRTKTASQVPAESGRKTSAAVSARKPLPQDPPISQDTRAAQEAQAALSRVSQRPTNTQATMQPPPRPMRDPPRSVSDSINAFGQLPSSSTTRPTTGGSMASTSAGRLPSRGNSYSQPLAPIVATNNAHGALAQPKSGRQYNISAPIPQQEPYHSDVSIGAPSAQRVNSRYSQAPPPREEPKSHKRSNTFGSVFSRSTSFFGGKSQPQAPSDHGRQQPEKKYPPTSMKAPIASESPRQSTDSRRPSFSFGRKNSDPNKPEKARRFSILPGSFSLKGLSAGSKDSGYESARPRSQRKQSVGQQHDPRTAVYGQPTSRTNSEASTPVYDGSRDRNRNVTAPHARRTDVPVRGAQVSETTPRWAPQPANTQNGPLPPGQSYYLNDSVVHTESDVSLAQAQSGPRYPQGFNSHEEEPRVSMQQVRNSRGVLQKPNRKFEDAYEQETGHHSGSTGAAKRVMDFFRRRGKSRAGDDR